MIILKLQLSSVGSDPNENHFSEPLFVISVFMQISVLSGLGSLFGLGLSFGSFVLREGKRIPGVIGLILNGAILFLAGRILLNITW